MASLVRDRDRALMLKETATAMMRWMVHDRWAILVLT
jgi:hypothetical protein